MQWIKKVFKPKNFIRILLNPRLVFSHFRYATSRILHDFLFIFYRKHKFNIVFIGNISKVLEFEDLCYSAKSLLNYKDIQFVICGSGDDLEEAKKLSENLKNIIFTNWINQKEIIFCKNE